jgi:hypothetical protein
MPNMTKSSANRRIETDRCTALMWSVRVHHEQ